ncbi:MAG: dihydrodipicolinate synthase family protein [Dehalococcoidia bacterium]
MLMNIQGLVVPAITPRMGAGVDSASLAGLLEFLIDGGVDAIFILGTTGEFRHLSLNEKRQVIKRSAECIRNRVPMLVGISAQTIEESLALMDASQECGAQALVLAPMFGETEPSKQISTVIGTSSLPIVLYNNPAIHRKASLPLSIVEEFASHPRVIGIKDSSGDWDYFLKLLELKSPDFGVLQGKESMIVQSIEAGSGGIVAGVANIIPALCKELWLKRDQETMDRVTAVKSEIKQSSPNSISGYKQRLVELGIIRSATLFSD